MKIPLDILSSKAYIISKLSYKLLHHENRAMQLNFTKIRELTKQNHSEAPRK